MSQVKKDEFVKFSQARKDLIIYMKGRLTDPANLHRELINEYGNRAKNLELKDYSVYAAVRGADWKKASHMQEGENARVELMSIHGQVARLKAKGYPETLPTELKRYAPSVAHLDELEACLAAALTL